MRPVLLLLPLAACGRLGFEPTGSDADADRGGDSGGSGVTACVVGAAEQCNGIDDNCDGIVDDGCPCTPFSVRLTPAPTLTVNHAVAVSIGTSMLVFDHSAQAFRVIDGTGTPGATVPVAFSVADDAAVWDGSALVHAHPGGAGIQLDRVTLAGVAAPLSSVTVTAPLHGLALARGSDGTFALAWIQDGASMRDVIGTVLDASGSERGARTTFGTGITAPILFGVTAAPVPVLAFQDVTGSLAAQAFGQSTPVFPGGPAQGALGSIASRGQRFALISATISPSVTSIDATGTVKGTTTSLPGYSISAGQIAPAPGGFVYSATATGAPKQITYARTLLDTNALPMGSATTTFTSAGRVGSDATFATCVNNFTAASQTLIAADTSSRQRACALRRHIPHHAIRVYPHKLRKLRLTQRHRRDSRRRRRSAGLDEPVRERDRTSSEIDRA